VVEELSRAGVRAQLAEPADTAAARGRKKRAKTDRTDAKLLRELLIEDRVPQCWIPPTSVLETRALLELYHDLRREHTAWAQRVHAVFFHQGAPALGNDGVDDHRQRLAELAAVHLSPAGQLQIDVALAMLETLENHRHALRKQLVTTARHLQGAKTLADTIYGVGPITALALCCWLGGAGRFSSSRKAVRFAGLDVTVYSSAGKRGPGHLSRQGPPLLRWCLYEAAKTSARPGAPDHSYYAQIRDRIDGKRAALSQARRIVRRACHLLTNLGDDAFTMV
jgi:transposase